MAGMSSVMLWIPINKLAVQTQTRVRAFLGMELYCKNVSRRDCAGKAHAVMAYPNTPGRIDGGGVTTVHDIQRGPIRNTLPKGVVLHPPHATHAPVRPFDPCRANPRRRRTGNT